jgi:hypothetical protein
VRRAVKRDCGYRNLQRPLRTEMPRYIREGSARHLPAEDVLEDLMSLTKINFNSSLHDDRLHDMVVQCCTSTSPSCAQRWFCIMNFSNAVSCCATTAFVGSSTSSELALNFVWAEPTNTSGVPKTCASRNVSAIRR